jgi:hypothetical protein
MILTHPRVHLPSLDITLLISSSFTFLKNAANKERRPSGPITALLYHAADHSVGCRRRRQVWLSGAQTARIPKKTDGTDKRTDALGAHNTSPSRRSCKRLTKRPPLPPRTNACADPSLSCVLAHALSLSHSLALSLSPSLIYMPARPYLERPPIGIARNN